MREEFWNSLLTEKSWKVLQEIRIKYNFVLIGGWAIYLLTRQHKSQDIDIVVGIKELEKFKSEGLSKNDHLQKYEIKREEIDIDIYVEYYSKLVIPVEDIKNYAVEIEAFKVASPELLLILKQSAYDSRRDSTKGEKDAIDILSLLFYSEIDFRKYLGILKKYRLEEYFKKLKALLKSFKSYEYFNLNPREFKLKKNKAFSDIEKY